MAKKLKEIQLSDFQIRNIRILAHLLEHDAVNDEVVDYLRETELDYFTLLDKIKFLEKKVNIDEKTSLLKFKPDYLTNILKTASRIFHGIKTAKYSVSFIRFDIDDFSNFNNKYGHDIGDQILIKLAQIIRNNSRPTDYIIRFGGEEFDAILPSTDIKGALVFINKIFKKIRNIYLINNSKKITVTVSAGLSHVVHVFSGKKMIDDQTTKAMYEKIQSEADNALYEAKYLGKNRYCVYTDNKKSEYTKIRKLYVK